MTNEERIKADAEAYARQFKYGFDYRKPAYIDGATAENSRTQVLVDFIQEIIDFPPAQSKAAMSEWIDKYRDEARVLLEQWKGKEVGDDA